jgi:hypothetical protein
MNYPRRYGSWYSQSLVIDHFLGGHEMLCPAGRRQGDAHLDPELRIFQSTVPRQGGEARILYTRCSLKMAIEVPRAVRRLVWPSKTADKSVALFPTRSETYRVTPRKGRAIDEAGSAFEESMTQLEIDLSLHAEFGTDPKRDWLINLPRLHRSIAARAFPMAIDLRFGAGAVPPTIDRAWEDLWGALGACFVPQYRIRARTTWWVDPKKLFSALGSSR